MPAWFALYLMLMATMTVVDVGYALRMRGRLLWIVHELLAMAFFLGFAAAYWLAPLRAALDPVHVPLFALLLATECHLSLNTDPRDFGVPLPEGIGPREVDLVKALSSLAMLPAYIPGVLLCAELLVPFRG